MEQRKTPLTEEEITREEFPELEPVEKERELFQRILGIAGSVLLIVAPFAPLISTPKLPRIAMYLHARADALGLLVLAVVALALCVYGRCGFLWVSGTAGVFELGNLSYFLYAHSPEVLSSGPQGKVGVLGFVGAVLWSNPAADWGTIVLLGGTLISLAAAISAGFQKRGLTPAAKLGICLLLLVAAYQAFLIFYPYWRYSPFVLRQ